jgi:hypothetical protein
MYILLSCTKLKVKKGIALISSFSFYLKFIWYKKLELRYLHVCWGVRGDVEIVLDSLHKLGKR